MEKRLNIEAIEPKAFKAMYGLVGYLQASSLNKAHIHLINTRASQINGCAYCLNMHTKEALDNGETQQRLFVLSAWRETDLFTEEEKSILSLTEEITLIHQHGVSDAVYKKAVALLGENYVAQVIMAIVTINGWNRIAISTNLPIGA